MQHNILTLVKNLNNLIFRPPFYVIIRRSYNPLKTAGFLDHRVYNIVGICANHRLLRRASFNRKI